MNVGYIGLGAMGGALARRLLAAHELVVWDINKAVVAEFEKLGASTAASGAELARRCDVLLLCLPRSSNVRQVIFGPGGLAEGLTAGKIVVDQTSGVPTETREMAEQLAERGVAMIDAPVSGGVGGAAAGTITIMVSGPDEAYEKALPVLSAISPNVERCGGRVGNAQAMKLVNNAMSAGGRLATLEVVAMGKKMGLSLETVTDIINKGSGRNRTSKVMLPALLEGKPAAGSFALSLMLKDLSQAISLGMECGAPMPIANVVRGLLQIGVNTIGENAQLEDVLGLIESMAATRIVETSKAA
jgi:3-hydroxyisobutyrate dehydrogenase